MRDRNGLSIHTGDRVSVQTTGAATMATVIDAHSDMAQELKSVLVQFENGTAQYMPPTTVAVQR